LDDDERMKIATYNVDGIKTRLPNLLQWLEREHPDVACLRELKAMDDAFPQQPLREAGYHALWKGPAFLEAAVEGVAVVCQVNAEAFSTAARCA
jgi:exodeoxyribonuclease III